MSGCLSLVGMAGAGKTTVGKLLARRLGWAHLDTDLVIESYYGLPLQVLHDDLGREEFLRVEEQLVSMLGLRRVVVSTGGSVIYGRRAVDRLRLLGGVVFLHIGLETFLDRVGSGRGRAFVMGPGQDMAGVYRERQALYRAAADITVSSDELDPEQCVSRIMEEAGL